MSNKLEQDNDEDDGWSDESDEEENIYIEEKIKENEIIVLIHLNKNKYPSYKELLSYKWKIKQKQKIEKDKTKEEIEKEVEKEILEEIEKFKVKSLTTHYKIDNEKVLELVNSFGSSKLKIPIINPINLENGNICSNKDFKTIIYEIKHFKILFEISFKSLFDKDMIYTFLDKSIIQLDNKDLIIFIREKYENILIYRLKGKKYYLFQKIIEDKKGYETQIICQGCCIRKAKKYQLEWIKKLSNNRFITISNYGFKIYSLNENNEYSLILMDTTLGLIKQIYEINENNLIFCVDQYIPAKFRGIPRSYNSLIIEKVELNKIKTNEINEKINCCKKKRINLNFPFLIDDEEFVEDEIKKIIESLKLIHRSEKLYSYGRTDLGFHKFSSNYVVLKNKYFLIMIDNNILIFDILKGTKLKEYTILEEGDKNLYINNIIKIQKWNSINDNEFIMIEYGNIFLFELNENSLEGINLKIISYSYFPGIDDLTKMNEEENRFYSYKKDHILIY